MFNQNPFYSAYPSYGSMMGGAPGGLFGRGGSLFGGAPGGLFGRGGSLFGGAPGGLFGRGGSLFGGAAKTGFNWGGLLTNAQKTLGIINQAIPAFQQIKPVWDNARTMFRVFGEFNKMNKSENNARSSTTTEDKSSTTISNNSLTYGSSEPNFFA